MVRAAFEGDGVFSFLVNGLVRVSATWWTHGKTIRARIDQATNRRPTKLRSPQGSLVSISSFPITGKTAMSGTRPEKRHRPERPRWPWDCVSPPNWLQV